MGTLEQEKAKVIQLIEGLDADQLEAVRTVLADTTRDPQNSNLSAQEPTQRDFVPCPMASCNMWMRKGRKPTVHYRAAHPGVDVPETV